jgi:hypothetical protein
MSPTKNAITRLPNPKIFIVACANLIPPCFPLNSKKNVYVHSWSDDWHNADQSPCKGFWESKSIGVLDTTLCDKVCQ